MSQAEALPLEEAVASQTDVEQESPSHGGLMRNWFGRLVAAYLHRRYKSGPHSAAASLAHESVDRGALAESLIRRACIKASLAGATVSSVATTATVLTAETEGLLTFITLPTTLAGLGLELAARSVLHLGLTCDLLDLFGVSPDPEDHADIGRLYALAFGGGEADGHEGSSKELVEHMVAEPMHRIGESLGAQFIGESLARNLVPVVGVAVSTVQSWRSTRSLGDTVRRYARYRRALRDTFAHIDTTCETQMDLLIEGLWFIFSADGRLNPEEAAILTGKLKRLEVTERNTILGRFTEDEFDWLDRLERVPEGLRGELFHAFEVAATVDKIVSGPERRVLRHAAHRLGQEYSEARLEELIRAFTDTGVLEQRHRP